ncbi:MAG: PilZ domain-containing protein [Gammaproteobacteria bacterium]|nr:PilZ domain-containing protein [Gammaproteobacteria bacterium]
MPDNTTIRKFIRHPVDMPIQVRSSRVEDEQDIDEDLDQTITNVSLGGLAFESQKAYTISDRVRINIPILDRDNNLIGNVAWCEEAGSGYVVGIKFVKSRDFFRMRMIEQICHIEHYRDEVLRTQGRELSAQEAAAEWISKYAGDFPAL